MRITQVTRTGFALVGIVALALVFAAMALTQWLALAPCPLCIFQRLLYLLLGAFAIFAAFWTRPRPFFGALALISALGGFTTAAYQSWMQAFPDNFLTCGSGEPTNPIETLVAWLGERVPSMFLAWGECTSREWSFLHLSLANWSALLFFSLIVVLILLLRRRD